MSVKSEGCRPRQFDLSYFITGQPCQRFNGGLSSSSSQSTEPPFSCHQLPPFSQSCHQVPHSRYSSSSSFTGAVCRACSKSLATPPVICFYPPIESHWVHPPSTRCHLALLPDHSNLASFRRPILRIFSKSVGVCWSWSKYFSFFCPGSSTDQSRQWIILSGWLHIRQVPSSWRFIGFTITLLLGPGEWSGW